MKKYILFFILLCVQTMLIAQPINIEDVITNLKAGNILKAKEIADKAIITEPYKSNPKTWFFMAITYHSIYESLSQDVKSLSKSPLYNAYEAYIKCFQLDQKKEFNTEVIKALRIVSSQFVYEGIQYFNKADYNMALSCFENNIAINRLPEINQLDTIIIYNAALSAEKAEKFPIAIEYYEQLIKLGFNGSKMYLDQALLYKKINNEPEYLKIIQNGIKAYPNNDISLISELINYYLDKGNNEEAMNYVEKGLMREPTNPAFHFAKGSLFDQNGDLLNAEKEYKNTLKYDPDYTDVSFNLGVLYYNQATTLIKKATNKDEQNKAFGFYKESQPYLEQANMQLPNDVQIMKMLKTVYTLLKQDDKLQEINNKLEKQ